ncbi:putative F-box protein [Prunus yedoensis var. nudiflora]|uniref:Putative F-box protein n=1 Tax=Prunus yedoensis var. nudiflora TaxID=2094558 RepID=A0A314Z3Z2_PRUYE|nr:putative F-box protein [Prunus yedoensis var. nudiflora]
MLCKTTHQSQQKKKHKAAMDGSSSRVDWTNLPPQLYPLIAQNLKTHIEVRRFRSVCSSWRSSIPPFCASVSPNFPFPHGPTGFLSQITVYLTRPDPNPNPSSSSSSPSSKGWLLKLEECADKIRLLNPITNWRVSSVNDDVARNPTDLNLMDLNMVELGKAYALRYTKGSGSIFGINKVIVAPNFIDCSIFMIYNEGKLGFAQNGNEKLTLINDQISDCDDLIVYKGQPCVINKRGQIFRINSSLELVPFSPPIGFGCRKNLIECCGELYVVDRYLDQQVKKSKGHPLHNASLNFFRRHPLRRRRIYEADHPKAIDFKVYKLGDEELGGRWVEVNSLGGQAFFLSVDFCFSVLARELDGCKGNCIYFTDSNDISCALKELIRSDRSVFSLEDRSINWLSSSPVYSQMFWPLPA